jgi:hypothetical protein
MSTNALISYNGWIFSPQSGFPVPQLSVSTQQNRLNDGPITSFTDTYTLEGKIYRRPQVSGSFDELLRSASTLRNVFNRDGILTVSGCNGGLLVSPTGAKLGEFRLNTTPNYWTQTIDYTISLSVERTGGCSGEGFISSANNTWQIQPIEEFNYYANTGFVTGLGDAGAVFPAFKITHTVSAVGKYIPSGTGCPTDYGRGMLLNAISWVSGHFDDGKPDMFKIGFSGIYDFTRNINSDVNAGSYTITDNYIYFPSGTNRPYLESFNINSQLDDSFNRTVTIQGTVKGLSTLKNPNLSATSPYQAYSSGDLQIYKDSKFYNALSGYKAVESSMYIRAQNYAGYIPTGFCSKYPPPGQTTQGHPLAYLNPRVRSSTIGYNPAGGEVTYSFTFDNRPKNLIDCSINESFSVTDNLPTPQIAETFVLGRRLGPILQNLGTFSLPQRSVTFEMTLPKPSAISGLIFPTDIYNSITGILESFNPQYLLAIRGQANDNNYVVKSFVKEDSETWNPTDGKFTKNKSWVYTKCYGTLANLDNPNVR